MMIVKNLLVSMTSACLSFFDNNLFWFLLCDRKVFAVSLCLRDSQRRTL